MRLGVLDVGSNTVHLLMVDAHRGGHPTPMRSMKVVLGLAEQIEPSGVLSERGVATLTATVGEFAEKARQAGCQELMAFATSAVREAANVAEILEKIRAKTGVDLRVLSGSDEARLTFLAVRRWYGWGSGRIIALDIGGGSLEMSNGVDEEPDVAMSLPLGAGRLTRTWFGAADPPARDSVMQLREWLDTQLVNPAARLLAPGAPDLVVATSKTFRTLARLTGAAPSSAGLRVRRVVTASGLRQLIAFISRMSSTDRAELEGVSIERSRQIVAGALVAESVMRALGLDSVDICPWALREGLILKRLDREEAL